MLTRDMLRYRVRRGEVKPAFIDPAQEDVLAYAQALLDQVSHAVALGRTRGEVDDNLAACAGPHLDLLLTRGLRKLVSDMCTYAEPSSDAPALRAQLMAQGTATLRALPIGATRADFCAQLHQACGSVPHLYSDLPQERLLTEVKTLDATTLLERYNMAQVQGLVMACKTLRITTSGGDLRAMRRVLRWLKFTRLVAEVQKRDDGTWHMEMTGPADMFEHAKKYGLQLAMFVPVVPLLANYLLEAEVALRPGASWQLKLSQSDPIVSPYNKRLGVMPKELQHIVKTFDDAYWRLDTHAAPLPVGAYDMMLPDFTCIHANGQRVHVELFHRWHRHALTARLRQLKDRPDTRILLGIDKSLAAHVALAESLPCQSAVQTFLFNAFPNAKKLRERLQSYVSKE